MEYTYNIYSLDTYPNYDNYQHVVFRVVYQLVARSGDYVASTTTDINLEYQAGSTFIPYEDLTKSTIIGWIESTLGQQALDKMKTDLRRNIECQMNPVIESLPLPFEN